MCITYVTGEKQKPFYTYVTLLCKMKGHIWHHKCVNNSYWHVWIYFYTLHHWEGEYIFIRLWTRGPQICRTIYKPLPNSTHQKCDMNQVQYCAPTILPCPVNLTTIQYFQLCGCQLIQIFAYKEKKKLQIIGLHTSHATIQNSVTWAATHLASVYP